MLNNDKIQKQSYVRLRIYAVADLKDRSLINSKK